MLIHKPLLTTSQLIGVLMIVLIKMNEMKLISRSRKPKKLMVLRVYQSDVKPANSKRGGVQSVECNHLTWIQNTQIQCLQNLQSAK